MVVSTVRLALLAGAIEKLHKITAIGATTIIFLQLEPAQYDLSNHIKSFRWSNGKIKSERGIQPPFYVKCRVSVAEGGLYTVVSTVL